MDKPFPAYRGDEAFVFVCYAHEDADIVYPELAWLNAQGIEFWYDEGISAGANWRATIGDAIFKAARVLFYVSRASLRSDHCNREINLALDEGKELVPVYLEDVELTSDLKVGLNRVQALHRERDANYRQNILSALGGRGEVAAEVRESLLARLARRRVRLATAVTMAAMAVALAFAVELVSSSGSSEADRAVRRFQLDFGTTGHLIAARPQLLAEAAIAPDGSRIAYVSAENGKGPTMYMRTLDQLEPTRLDVDVALSPSFSPDGKWLLYYTFFGGSAWLAKLAVATGRSERLVRAFPPVGATWLPDGTIVFIHNDRGFLNEPADWAGGRRSSVFRMNANGGEVEQLTFVDVEAGEISHARPTRLPDGEHVLFDLRTIGAPVEGRNVAVLNVRTGDREMLIENASGARYAPSGHIVFLRDGGLWAAPFDADTRTVVGEAALVEPSVADANGYDNWPVDIAEDGSAVIVPASGDTAVRQRPVWVDRQGRVQTSGVPLGRYEWPRVAPDGQRIVFQLGLAPEQDLWIHDMGRLGSLTRLTVTAGIDATPTWSPDARHLYYLGFSEGTYDIFRVRSDGAAPPERILAAPGAQAPSTVSADGRTLVFSNMRPEGAASNDWDIAVLPLDGASEPTTLIRTEFTEGSGELSPDGRWIAYASNESGLGNVYVRPYPNVTDGRWQISNGGGLEPAWSASGDEIFYRNGNGVYGVPVATEPTFRPGLPTLLFEGDYYRVPLGTRQYDVTYFGGERFLMLENVPPDNRAKVVYVDNWTTELERLAPHPTGPG